MNPQPTPDAIKSKQLAEQANNAMLAALYRYAVQHDAALLRAIRESRG